MRTKRHNRLVFRYGGALDALSAAKSFYRLTEAFRRGDCSLVRLSKKTRGSIETLLDDALRGEDGIVADVEWIRQEIPLSSFRDFARGYAIGMLKMLALLPASLPSFLAEIRGFTWSARDKEGRAIDAIANTIVKRRLPEILEKVERELGK